MPNVTLVDIVSTTGATGNFIASAMSTNFRNIRTLVNVSDSGGFDSANYATDSNGFGSQQISTGQIGSQHLTNGAVASGKLASAAIADSKINYLTSASGVRVIRAPCPAGFASIPGMCRISQSQTIGNQTSDVQSTVTLMFSNAIDGVPSYTTTPVPCGFVCGVNSQAGSAQAMVRNCGIVTMDSVSCVQAIMYGAQLVNNTVTWYQAFLGNM